MDGLDRADLPQPYMTSRSGGYDLGNSKKSFLQVREFANLRREAN
jgi:hypothetical protein